MRSIIKFSIILLIFPCCKRIRSNPETSTQIHSFEINDKKLIRSISFYGTDQDYGIEINGDKAFLRKDSPSHERIEISYSDALDIIDGFYKIPELKIFSGERTTKRDSTKVYLLRVYDELPERYSDKWADYVIPKNELNAHPALKAWFEKISALKSEETQSIRK